MGWAQPGFSLITDVSLLHNASKGARFTTIGQTIGAQFHSTKKTGAYVHVSYYVNGSYRNNSVATSKDTGSAVIFLPFSSRSRLGYRGLSLGYKQFLRGSFDNEESWNVYATAGFGLLSGSIENVFDRVIDSSIYVIPGVAVGSGRFTRLTFDVALGAEKAMAAGFFLYGEVRTWLQASSYPSPYLQNNNVPNVLLLNGGVRILFN